MNDTPRTDDNEPRTDVYFVKTSETQAGVIVSFTDAGEEDPVGIYLFEPGADPVELDSVGISGTASEFEYATITVGQRVDSQGVRLSYGPANRHWKEVQYPGDGMVTFARRDADIEAATEEHKALVNNHEKLTEQTRALVDAARQDHHEHHAESFAFCGYAVCKAAAVAVRVVDL